MFIPFSFLLIPYGLALLIFFVLGFFNMYHIYRFGVFNARSTIFTLIFVVLSAATLVGSFLLLSQIDWGQGMNIEFFLSS